MKVYGGIDCIDTIGDRFSIRAELPDAVMPALDWEAIKNLFPVAITIAVLGAIESLLSATVADGVIGDKHDSNTELIAQGVANMATPLFGGIPATGAIARTMANINNGGKTPVAGMVHAVVLLLILLFLMPLAQYIPMACLAGVLVIVSYNMSGWRTFKALLKNPKSDVTVLLITFFLTVIFDLTIAIEVGLVIACVLFMRRVMETTEISVIKDEIDPNAESDIASNDEHLIIPEDVEVYEINGPYFFGIATKFEEIMARLGNRPKVRIRCSNHADRDTAVIDKLCQHPHKTFPLPVVYNILDFIHHKQSYMIQSYLTDTANQHICGSPCPHRHIIIVSIQLHINLP